MTKDRRVADDNSFGDEVAQRRDWCHVYNAGDGIVEVIASFADHYNARPDKPWQPKGETVEELVAEVGAMTLALNQAMLRSQRLINFVMEAE